MLQTIKYPKGTKFKVTNGESVLEVINIDGSGPKSMLTMKYREGKEGVFVQPISQVDRMVDFKSWEQLNNKAL
jgi:hypothetical protein